MGETRKIGSGEGHGNSYQLTVRGCLKMAVAKGMSVLGSVRKMPRRITRGCRGHGRGEWPPRQPACIPGLGSSI